MMSPTRMFNAVFLCLIISFCTGCGLFKEEEKKEKAEYSPLELSENQNININLFTEPPTLDPRKANDTTSFHMTKMLFEGLTRVHAASGDPLPAAAEEIEISDDLTEYTFKLRKSFWSNGDRVTAYDFEYAWKAVLDPNAESAYAYQLYVIKNAKNAKTGIVPVDEVGVRALNATTLHVTLNHPTPYFLELISFTTYYPVHKNTAEANESWADKAGEAFVCNGPFTLTEWKHNNEITVTKNEKYWNKDSVNLNTIRLVMISDEMTELNMFEREELDWAGRPMSRLPAAAIPTLKRQGILRFKPVAGIEWYKFNTGRFPFNNLKMRKAFSYAINRKALIEKLMPENHTIATGIIPPPLSLQHEPYFGDGDIELARKLFNEALSEMGITREDLPTITLSFNAFEAHKLLSQAIQHQWRKAFNITIELQSSEWKVHLSKLRNHDYHIGRSGWSADFRDPINFLEIFKYRNDPETGGNNDTQWENENYAELLDLSASIVDPDEREEILHQAEILLIEEMPIAPIYFMTDNYVKNPKLKGVVLSSLGDIDFSWAYIAK
jgi:oligopeptide transport system substrate-binding protein